MNYGKKIKESLFSCGQKGTRNAFSIALKQIICS